MTPHFVAVVYLICAVVTAGSVGVMVSAGNYGRAVTFAALCAAMVAGCIYYMGQVNS